MFIRSERLFLRPIWPEDRHDLSNAIPDSAVARQICKGERALVPAIRTQFGQACKSRLPHFLVTLPDRRAGSRLLGAVGLFCESGELTMGIWLVPEHEGQGYAEEAGRAVLALAATLGHRRVAAMPVRDNTRAARLLTRLGFRPTCGIHWRRGEAEDEVALEMVQVVDLADAPARGDDFGGGSSARRAA